MRIWSNASLRFCYPYKEQVEIGDIDMRSSRNFTWFIIDVQVLFLIGIFWRSGASSDCNGISDWMWQLDFCEARTALAGIGVGIIIFLWAFVDIILGVIWLVTNRYRRYCPVCGRAVKKGKTSCVKCGHNFAATGAAASVSPNIPPPPTSSSKF